MSKALKPRTIIHESLQGELWVVEEPGITNTISLWTWLLVHPLPRLRRSQGREIPEDLRTDIHARGQGLPGHPQASPYQGQERQRKRAVPWRARAAGRMGYPPHRRDA